MFEQPNDQPTTNPEQAQDLLQRDIPPSDGQGSPGDNSRANLVQPEIPDATQEDLRRVREIIMGGSEPARQPIREAEVERLRAILFGTQMEEYERRFTDLRREIDRVLNDLHQARDAMDEFRESQREHVDTVEDDLRKTIEELGREVERARSQGPILQQLVPQVRQSQTMFNRLDEEVNDLRASLTRENQDMRALRTMIEQYRDQYERSISTLKREKRQAEDELKEELRRVADRLTDQKTDRKLLAAALVELATRLETGYGAMSIVEDFKASGKE